MEKSLKIYTFVDGVKDVPFPDLANQVEAFDFTYSTSRMNVIPQLSASVMFKRCLDSEWNGEQYILFNGERYFIKLTPSSSKDNTDARWKHDITFVSERNILSGIYFYDVVTSDTETDKYVSNSSNVLFFSDIHEFASRLNYSLQYSEVDYSVVIDDGISSEAMQVAFEDKFISEAIQEIYNIFDLPYYFVGKVCHIGYTSNAITTVLKYGDKDALLSIQKTNANYKIVNSCTGIGSTDNIPFYYPNPSNDRAAIEAAGGKWITPSVNLMPPIYRTSLGAERFYPAKNNTYTDPETGLKYMFENTYTTKNPHQHKVLFESIKPSIKGMMNGQATPKPMDKFLQFAYDANDNDELDEENNFKHPYFFAKLPIYNGTFGFNLFDQAIVGQDMSMSMTSGNCGACNFVIGVDADSQKNVVQLNEDGTLKRDKDGNVITVGSPQTIQNDTTKYEVWIALKKDDSTFGILMPNAGGNYKPSVSDTFVILGIDMPQSYISAAEDRLYKEIIKYMFLNNAEKFTFAINFSRIYLAENPLVYNQLNENARIRIEYNGKEENLYISDYTYKVSKSEALPDITVTLSDTLTVRKGTLQTSIDSVKQEIMSSVGSSDFYKQGLKYFVRKDVPDYAVKITAKEGFDVGSYAPNTSGGTFRRNADGTTLLEVDKLLVRIKAYFEKLEVVSTRYSGGNNVYSAAAMSCTKVEDKGAYYRCYFTNKLDGTEVKNRFVVGDQVRCQEFDLIKKNGIAVTNRSYWRLVTGIGSNYIDTSKTDAMAGSDIPLAGDDIVQFGNRTEKDRQNLIIQYTVGVNAPLYSMLQGVNSYSLEGKDILQQGFNASTGKAFQRIYGDSYIGARDLSQFMKYTPEGGLEIKGKITSVGGDGITDSLDKIEEEITTIKTESDLFAESVTKDIEGLQDQIDGAIETWFEDPIPTLANKPAKDWTTPAIKNTHLGDLYYSGEGKAYRFQMNGVAYEWKVLSDSDITLALANAKKAQDTADGKRRVYIRQPLNAETYDVGDLWTNATFETTYSNDLLRCKVAKVAGVAFSISHWEKASKYTDDTAADAAAKAASSAQATANTANTAVTAIKDFTDVAFADGVIDRGEAAAIEKYKNTVNESQKSIQGGYTTLYANGYLTGTAKTGLKTAYDAVEVSITALLAAINTAIADKKTTDAEKLAVDTAYATFNAKLNLYYAAVETANKSIQDVLKKYSDDALAAVADLSYLTTALNGNTSIQGGLVLTSLISLGTGTGASFIPKSGLNGIYNAAKTGGGIAFWVGGAMKDRADYTTATMPTDVAKGIDRFDGSGYRANGNMSWNAAGELTVSTQFFKVISSTGISKLEYSNVRDTLDFNANLLFKTGITLKFEGDTTDYIPYLKWLKSVFENDATNDAVKVNKSLYSLYGLSAKGLSPGGGGGGGATALSQLIDVNITSPTNRQALVYDSTSSKWINGSAGLTDFTVKVGNTSYSSVNGIVSLPAYPTYDLSNYLPLTGGSLSGKLYIRTTVGNEALNVNGYIATHGTTGWINTTYGGGIWMQDDEWVRVYGGKKFFVNSVDTSAISCAGGLSSNLNTNHANIWSNKLFTSYAVFNVTPAMVPGNTFQNIIGWTSTIDGMGYVTRYSIGSGRASSGWGMLELNIGNSDGGDSGHTLSLGGSGGAAWTGNFTAQRISCGFDAAVNGGIAASNWFRSYGTSGWYNETYQGGIYQTDSNHVRVYNNKVLYNDGYRDWGIGGHNCGLILYSNGHIGINLANSIYTWGIYSNNDGNMYIGRRDGNRQDQSGSYVVVLGINQLTMNGSIIASGAISAKSVSDQRFKINAKSFTDANEFLLSLGEVQTYEYNEAGLNRTTAYATKGTHIGLFHHNVEKRLPSMAFRDDDGYGGLNYLDTDYINLIAAATQQTYKLAKNNRSRIEKLEDEVNRLKIENDRLINT